MTSYSRADYDMMTVTLTVPTLDNDGADVGHVDKVRTGLLAAGIESWTEHDSRGSWKGKLEPGTVFTFYVTAGLGARDFAHTVGRIGRRCMPDQEAVQVTFCPHIIALIEA